MLIGGFQKSSLIDYPEKISAVVFTQGCNFKCPYCHNPELIIANSKQQIANSQIIDFLKSRVEKLDGVVITGGEPTLHKGLPDFVKQVKDMGFYIKLDTNGTNPQMLKDLIENKLIDYVAMDIKAPIENYQQIVCSKVDTDNIIKSIELLKTSGIDYEFRTTVVNSQLSIDDFKQIGEMIKGAKKYYLQRFLPTKVLDEAFISAQTYSDEEFSIIIRELRKNISEVRLR